MATRRDLLKRPKNPVSGFSFDALVPSGALMDEELRILHEAMVIKDRLKVLAELQSTYWEELLARGFDASVAEQLMVEWSRHAFGMTFRALPEPVVHDDLDELLGRAGSIGRTALPASGGDPSSVPPGEPWLQLVEDLDAAPDDDSSAEDRAA